MARRRTWLLFPAALPAAALFTPDFSFYPSQSINCLTEGAAVAKCSGATVQIMNKCLCGNTKDWISRAATCLGVEDPDDVLQVYSTMAYACSNTGTALVVSGQEFQQIAKDAGDSASSSTTSTTKTTTKPTAPTSTPTKMMSSMTTTTTKSLTQTTAAPGGSTSVAPTVGPSVTGDGGASSKETSAAVSTSNAQSTSTTPAETTSSSDSRPKSTPTFSPSDQASGKLSTAATVGVAVGASLAGVAVIAIAAVSLIRRKKRSNEEATAMIASPRQKPDASTSGAPPPASPPLPAELSSEVASPSSRHLSDQTLAWASPNEGRQFSFWPAVPGQTISEEEAGFSVVRTNSEIGERAPASEADQILDASEIHELDGTSAVGSSSVRQQQQQEPWRSEHPQRWSNF